MKAMTVLQRVKAELLQGSVIDEPYTVVYDRGLGLAPITATGEVHHDDADDGLVLHFHICMRGA